jgi:hypothetical protein
MLQATRQSQRVRESEQALEFHIDIGLGAKLVAQFLSQPAFEVLADYLQGIRINPKITRQRRDRNGPSETKTVKIIPQFRQSHRIES